MGIKHTHIQTAYHLKCKYSLSIYVHMHGHALTHSYTDNIIISKRKLISYLKEST
jgi:hypothetical protein